MGAKASAAARNQGPLVAQMDHMAIWLQPAMSSVDYYIITPDGMTGSSTATVQSMAMYTIL
jgi:hypothetical protein